LAAFAFALSAHSSLPATMATPAAIKTLQHRAAAQRGHFNRAVKELAAACDFCELSPTHRAIATTEAGLERLKDQKAKLDVIYEELTGVDEDDDRLALYDDRLDEISTEFAEITNRGQQVLHDAVAALVPPPAAPAPAAQQAPVQAAAQAGPPRPRICDALRPDKLSMDHSPAELRSWEYRFNGYYTASRLDAYNVAEQHVFTFAVMDAALETRVRESEAYAVALPVFGDADSIMAIVRQEFARRYPLFNRRWEYFRLEQEKSQAFSDFMIKLRRLGDEADLHRLGVDDVYVFRYITAVRDSKLRDRFLRLVDPTLAQLRDAVHAYEAGQHANEALLASSRAKTAAVKNRPTQQPAAAAQPRPSTSSGGDSSASAPKARKPSTAARDCGHTSWPPPKQSFGRCWRCGNKEHAAGNCPKKASDCKCDFCKREGHLRTVCFDEMKKKGGPARSAATSAAASEEPPPYSSSESDGGEVETCARVPCRAAGSPNRPTPTLAARFGVGDRRFSAQLTPDSGTTRTVVSKSLLDRAGVPYQQTAARLFVANDTPMNVTGCAVITTYKLGGVKYRTPVELRALVSSELNEDILASWHDLVQLGVLPPNFPSVSGAAAEAAVRKVVEEWPHASDTLAGPAVVNTRDSLFREFPTVLNDELETGHILGKKPMHIEVRDDVPMRPVRRLTSRPVPLHFRKEADKMIAALLAEGVLAKVDEASDWISAGHFVPKPCGKKLRLVTDYSDLNRYVKRPVHPFPSTSDILQNIPSGSTWFCKLDAVHGYFQIPLDRESSMLTTFLLPSGRYRYLRAPMGLSSSGDEFCRRSDEVLAGLPWTQKIVDDILVQAPSQEELFRRVREVLQRCKKHGLTVSRRKLELGQSVKFAGHIISAEGVAPDPDLLKAITDFPTPTDLTSLRSFLGMANQLSHFLPDATHGMVKMRQLLKKNSSFVWLPDHAEEFASAKKLLCSVSGVKYFDPKLPTVLLTDASRLYGLGFALVQVEADGKYRLIRAGSTSLSPAESRYATVELELLAIDYAVNKSAFFLRGMPQPFKVITDHRPLLGVFRRPLHEVENPRLQRMRGRLDGAGYVFTTEWTPGKEHLIADALSRAPVFRPDDSCNVDFRILKISDTSFDLFKDGASSWSYAQCVQALRRGVACDDLPPSHPARAYRSVWEALSLREEEGFTLMVYDGNRIVVPLSSRPEILRRLHQSHSGMTKTRAQARQLYFWPGMSSAIKNLVEACEQCVRCLPSQQDEPFVSPSMPSAPMEALGVDLCDFAGATWLVAVDRFSGFPFAARLTRTSTSDVTKRLLAWFYDWGFPKSIRSDGGPQFRSEFKLFCKKWDIVHETSSPYNPQSNGLAEAAVKNVKRLLAKTTGEKSSFTAALFAFRNTPRQDGHSPAQMLFGRRQRGRLPVLDVSMQQADTGQAARERAAVKRKSAASHDESARSLPAFSAGQQVYVQDPKTSKWDTVAVIVGAHYGGRSYDIEFTHSGSLSVRNRRFLRPVSASAIAAASTNSRVR
jgi:transposase InsO family protein